MYVLAGLIVLALSLLAWVGQVVSWLFPSRAVAWKLMEAEEDVEPAFAADVRGEAAWDSCSLWVAAVAGVLLIADHGWWPTFGLIGGGVYAYFGGRAVATRRVMQQRGLRIGAPENVRLGYAFSAIWGLMGLALAVASIITLES